MTADAVGGVWQYCFDLVSGLVREGAEVLLATFGPRPSPEQKREILALPGVTLAESDYALEWMPNPWPDVDASGVWLLALQSSFNPDVIHLNGYSHASLPWRKPVVVTAHSCVYSWWRAVHGGPPGEEFAEYKQRVMAGLTACEAITAPSAYMAGALQQEYRVPAEKIRVIHNFSRARSSAKPKQPFLMAAGRFWDPAKNLELLKRITLKLDWEVRVAESLPHSEVLRQLSGASIFVHPALYEPFGLSVLEAARARCCLVLSDIPSLRELWEDAAVFIDPRDPEKWIFKLNRLAQDSAARESMSRLAHRRASKYRVSIAVKAYSSLYRSLLSRAPGCSLGQAGVAA
ncbi:MAG: glycosyltransferase [Bryobacteraceae bacterium]